MTTSAHKHTGFRGRLNRGGAADRSYQQDRPRAWLASTQTTPETCDLAL